MQHNPEKVRQFLRALRHAEMFVRDHPEQTAVIIANATGLSNEVAHRAMRRHTYAVNLDDAVRASLRQTAEFLRMQRIIRQAPDFEQTVSGEYLKAALAQTQGLTQP